MKNKKRMLRAAACIGMGVLILSTAVFANIDNAGGYSVVKSAVKDMCYRDNFTAAGSYSFELDGNELMRAEAGLMTNGGGEPSEREYSKTYITNSAGESELTNESERVLQNGYRYNSYYDINYEPETSKTVYYDGEYSGGGLLGDDPELIDKQINFMEAIADSLIGDIKNNFVMTGAENGRSYAVNMSGEQLPKYISAGLSLVCSSMRQSGANALDDGPDSELSVFNELFLNEREPYVKEVNAEFDTDDSGRLSRAAVNVVLCGYDSSGSEREASFKMELNISDFDTTVIEPVNPNEYVSVDAAYAESAEVTVSSEDGESTVVIP